MEEKMIITHDGPKVIFEVGVVDHTCLRCGNKDKSLFYEYASTFDNKKICYCMSCIIMGRSDSSNPIRGINSEREKMMLNYHLDFDLNDIQENASDKIVDAIDHKHHLLLYAVTGAGKTEITFKGIQYARQKGLNVAFVSPRIDVVKEVYLRLRDAFKDAQIDLLYSGVKNVYSHMFTVCTVHQLMNYIEHYDFIIIDEVDAFPLPDEPLLMSVILRAASKNASIILMTATPTRDMIELVGKENIVTISRRYHGHDLTIPKIIYQDIEKYIKKKRAPHKLISLLDGITARDRKALVFVPEIKMLEPLKSILQKRYSRLESVYSGDPERMEKVQLMRDNQVDILLTTTILERGVTFLNLDVIVLSAERFDFAQLIQICGRVGRKLGDPIGNIWFLSSEKTYDIKETIRRIKAFNKGQAKL